LEDLLDSWPGTLIVVSHDRYLVERVTDQQYALIDGNLRHLPRGIDEYLQLRPTTSSNSSDTKAPADQSTDQPSSSTASPRLAPGSKEHRLAEKEQGQIERRLAKLQTERAQLVEEMAAIDPKDWEPLSALTQQVDTIDQEISEREMRWLELVALLEPGA
jgi:ATPase subunit of ABC transporter with duplicated ATPase domains